MDPVNGYLKLKLFLNKYSCSGPRHLKVEDAD